MTQQLKFWHPLCSNSPIIACPHGVVPNRMQQSESEEKFQHKQGFKSALSTAVKEQCH